MMNNWKEPKNSEKYYWTEHAKMKMRHYGLSTQRVTRVVRVPERREVGIAGDTTIAVMQPQSVRRDATGAKNWKSEIWVLYTFAKPKSETARKLAEAGVTGSADVMARVSAQMPANEQMRIISAWRYPGVTKVGEALPDVMQEEIEDAAGVV